MKTRLDKYSKGVAGRHETFIPRYGWLTKGYAKCLENPRVFNCADAIEQLGVGKNMVRSIRFWCLLLGLLKGSKQGKGELAPTRLGQHLIGKMDAENSQMDWNTGWDPYLEDKASLWLLHWQIFTHPTTAVSWSLAFNFSSLQIFSRQEFGASIINIADGDKSLSSISSHSFEKDAACIIHMYAPPSNAESEIRCPFNALGLIERTAENAHFRFAVRKRNNLSPLIFLATCFSYAKASGLSGETISLNQIAYGNDSPGIAFKLPETECGRLIDQAVTMVEKTHFIESAGTRQLHFMGDPLDRYWECLQLYYKERG
jgi:Protein of unknown function (DUF4007)